MTGSMLYTKRYPLYDIISTKEYVRIYKQIMQNKANFRDAKMNINTTVTMIYVILSRWLRPKNKPNSKPIKPKTNPIKAKTNPIQTQTNPILPAYKGALKDKNNDVIIPRITMKSGL